MAQPKTTLWKRGEHTEGKHLVLKHYFEAWFPILAKWNERILFIDGFAGPGEYEGGEPGSPLVAMRVLAQHPALKSITAKIVFVFIEKKADRARHLAGLVDQWRDRLPPNATVHVIEGMFSSEMSEVLDQLDQQSRRMAPTLVMIDPFGVKNIPITLVGRILSNPKCEVYVSFMWEAMNRHLRTSGFESHMTSLFGTTDWKRGLELSGQERLRYLHTLYKGQLKKAGAKQVVHFHLLQGNRLKYSIFFGTGNTKGSDCMKKAIWKIDPSEGLSFRGGQKDQMVLLDLVQPDFRPLRDALQEQFAGTGRVSIEDIVDFVRSDETIYHSGQLKTLVLKPMEMDGLIHVPSCRHRQYTYPPGCMIDFNAPQHRLL